MHPISEYLQRKERKFADGVELYLENYKLNPFENAAKWLKFFDQNGDKQQGSLEQNMLENRLKYLLTFVKEDKKKAELTSEEKPETTEPEKVQSWTDPDDLVWQNPPEAEKQPETKTEKPKGKKAGQKKNQKE